MKKFEPMYWGDLYLGEAFTEENYMIFYGNESGTLEHLKKIFPNLDLLFVEQFHSNIVVKAEPGKAFKADGHWIQQKNRALCIKTADCLPIFFVNKGLVVALHVGWRGVENEIIIQAMLEKNVEDSFSVFIGPHIQFQNFEVGLDVFDLLGEAYQKVQKFDVSSAEFYKNHVDSQKKYVNLAQIVRAQILSCGIDMKNIYESSIDTYSNNLFASHRRDPSQKSRNISFVALIDRQ